jgi:hypothetical protein
MISDATFHSRNGVSFLGSAKDQTVLAITITITHDENSSFTSTSFVSASVAHIAPPITYNVLALPPPGYILWAPISQPPGLTFFRPSDTKPKDGDIEASPMPSDWQYRTAIQREHWVEMTIFQRSQSFERIAPVGDVV